ncbi:MAG: universal stress protein [Proteobacteria bacterium]|nr:universal stress protein [Pseudomonadota bacterium]
MAKKTTVVGLDGSELAYKALDRVIAEATCGEVRIILVSVAEALATISPRQDYAELVTKLLTRARTLTDQGLERVRAAGHEAECIVESGRPAMVLAEVARREQADEIVVGSLGKHAVERMLLLGSVSSRLIDLAPCTVVVVR